MKVKKAKVNKKRMAIYKTSFGFREPYQVLVDGNFLHAIVSNQIPLQDHLAQLLVGQVKTILVHADVGVLLLNLPTLVITICTNEEIKGLGDMCGKARKAAYNIEKRKCRHNPLRHGGDCLLDLIGEDNKFRYCVATQDEALREQLRHIPGVPIIYFDHGMMLLEPVSDVTKQQRDRMERDKLSVSKEERAILHRLSGLQVPQRHKPRMARKAAPKTAKEPNSLSCKRKKDGPADGDKRRSRKRGGKSSKTLEQILAA